MAQDELSRLRLENTDLRTLLIRIYYMARRYASGRLTGAPSEVNRTGRALLALGVPREELQEHTGALFAFEPHPDRDTPHAREMELAYKFDNLDVSGRPDSEQAAFVAGALWMQKRCALAAQQQATWVTEDSYVAQVDLRSRIVASIEGQVIERLDKKGGVTEAPCTKETTENGTGNGAA